MIDYETDLKIHEEHPGLINAESAHEAYRKVRLVAGEAAPLDYREWGSIAVGATRRRLSFFVTVLCSRRWMYLEFTVAQTMDCFLACHARAFKAFGGGPKRFIIDNCAQQAGGMGPGGGSPAAHCTAQALRFAQYLEQLSPGQKR